MERPITRALDTTDPRVAAIIAKEAARQENGIELIASESYTSPAVMQAVIDEILARPNDERTISGGAL